jgi:hypothetical protein
MGEALGKTVVVIFLVLFGATGISAILDPDRFIRHSGVPKGGDMLRTWNRDGMRLAGAVFVVVALYMLYELLYH